MTVEVSKITAGPFIGNGITTTFPYQFRIERNEQLLVFETDLDGNTVELTHLTDYTIDGVGADAGEVTRTAGPLPTGYTWYIRSNYQPTQETAFSSQGAFFPAIHEGAFDKLTYLVLQTIDQVGRSFRLPDSFGGTVNLTLPGPAPGAYLRWSNDGQSLINDTDISVVINISGAVQTVANIAPQVVNVADNMMVVSSVGTNIGRVINVDNHLPVITNVNDHLPDIEFVVEKMPAIEAAPGAAQEAADNVEYAQMWAIHPEDVPIPPEAGGDGSTTFSSFHWAKKSEEHGSDTLGGLTDVDLGLVEPLDNLHLLAYAGGVWTNLAIKMVNGQPLFSDPSTQLLVAEDRTYVVGKASDDRFYLLTNTNGRLFLVDVDEAVSNTIEFRLSLVTAGYTLKDFTLVLPARPVAFDLVWPVEFASSTTFALPTTTVVGKTMILQFMRIPTGGSPANKVVLTSAIVEA